MTLDRKKLPIFAQIRVLFFERANTQLPTKLPTKKGRKLENLIFNREVLVVVKQHCRRLPQKGRYPSNPVTPLCQGVHYARWPASLC